MVIITHCLYIILCKQANWNKKRRLAYEPIIAVEYTSFTEKDMFCWGSTIHGELGLGGIEDENILVPREVDFKKATEIEQSKLSKSIHKSICKTVALYNNCFIVACGENYTVVITQDGEVYSCGNNDYGQLGHEKGRKRLRMYILQNNCCTTFI